MRNASALILTLFVVGIAGIYGASFRVHAPEKQVVLFDQEAIHARPILPTTAFSDQPPEVVAVPQRIIAQNIQVPSAEAERVLALPNDRSFLVRTLQSELQRVGCYDREINGFWTTSTRMAMQTFLQRVNAALPTDEPDAVLLSLLQAHKDTACGKSCPAGQGFAPSGQCLPNALVITKFKPQDPIATEGPNPIVTSSLPANTKPRTGAEERTTSERNVAVRQSASKPVKFVRTFLKAVQRDMAQFGLR
jgi:peptidoglycan hydrolase-like protein with peptidoglycan-binding domain